MDIQTINELINKQDGHTSKIYPLIADRLVGYSEYDLPFPSEFLFFEDKYLPIKKHMIENGINKNVVDIGCQLGIQSEIFRSDCEYLGIDIEHAEFFNSDKDNVSYIHGLFPFVDVDLSNKTVISSMSLGYFNGMFDEDEHKANEIITEKLITSKNLYIASDNKLIREIEPYYNYKKVVYKNIVMNSDFSVYFFTNY